MDIPATSLTPSLVAPGNALLAVGAPTAAVPLGLELEAVSPFAALMPVADVAPADLTLAGQTVADDGKPLPVVDGKDRIDPDLEAALAMAWSPAPAIPAVPLPQAAQLPAQTATLRLIAVDNDAPAPALIDKASSPGVFEPLRPAAEPAGPTPPITPSANTSITQALFVPGPAPSATPIDAPRTTAFVPDATLAPAVTPAVEAFRRDVRDRPATAVTLAALHTGIEPGMPAYTHAPAAQVFAAALHRFAAPLDGGSDTGEDDAIAPPAFGGALLTGAPITAGAIHAPLAADTALDMTGRNWPEAMITRIEALREAHDAASAKLDVDRMDSSNATLRLSPDALGAVEISLRRDADQVHVQIQAEQPRAQALLADAQPRLSELAEARGIRLTNASADTGDGTGQQAPRQPFAVASPIIANRTVAALDANGGDDRIA